jgi:hypothetical protein
VATEAAWLNSPQGPASAWKARKGGRYTTKDSRGYPAINVFLPSISFVYQFACFQKSALVHFRSLVCSRMQFVFERTIGALIGTYTS